jgi:alpha-galactosidase
VRAARDGPTIGVTNGIVSVTYDLDRGVADYSWGERTVIRNAYSSAVLADFGGRTIYSFEGGSRSADNSPFADALGSGVALSVTTAFPDVDLALVQQLYVYDGASFVTQRVSLQRLSADGGPVAAGLIEVIGAGLATTPRGGVFIEPAAEQHFYKAPFYNNEDFDVVPREQAHGILSYWLAGVVDIGRGHGVVLGALETERWKSAVWFDGPTGSISAHSGAQSPVDGRPPAPVRGPQVESALTFVGFRESYQDALADMMRLVRAIEPPLPPPALPAPIGWNPWYRHGHDADEATVRGVADFIADNWAAIGYRYINLDAGWNVADGDTRADAAKFPTGMESLVGHIHNRGLLAGAYFIPFAISPTLLDEQAPGSDFLYREMLVRDESGNPVRASVLDWEYVLDTTHPGALPLLYLSARQIADYGFDFVKLDFLQIGTQEGIRHNPNATAMQAFHRGMKAITEAWGDSGRPMFVSAAIAPLYVQRYAHARRVGVDVNFGQARQAKNVALSWFTGLLYHRNDPDNAVVRRAWFPGYTDGLAKLHVTMDALGGTLFIAGDDPRELGPARAALLTNTNVLAVARDPLVIRPIAEDTDPPPIWVAVAPDGSRLVGLFNWSDSAPLRLRVTINELALDAGSALTAVDLWTGHDMGLSGDGLNVELPPQDAALVRIRAQ